MNGKKAAALRKLCRDEFKPATDRAYETVNHTHTVYRGRVARQAMPQIKLDGECGRFAYKQLKKMYTRLNPLV